MTLNLFNLPDPLPHNEDIIDLVRSDDIRIERIVSTGQTTPEGQWYDQDEDEWVALIQGEAVLEYESGERLNLSAGDHVPPASPLPPPRRLHQPPATLHLASRLRQYALKKKAGQISLPLAEILIY